MGYDPRYDAFGALTLGGIGALGGLGYSMLNRKRRKNKWRNALIGAAALPTLYVGGKYVASKFLPEDQHIYLDMYDPMQYVSAWPNSYIWDKSPHDLIDKEKDAWNAYNDALTNITDHKFFNNTDSVPENLNTALTDAKEKYNAVRQGADQQREHIANTAAAIGYGTLGLGIGLPALYLSYLNKKKKKKNLEEEIA